MREKRTLNLTLRISPTEKEQWSEKAALSGLTLSQLIRLSIERTQTWTVPNQTMIQEQTRQIARIGNNLNQIAKWANTYKSTAEALEVIEALELIKDDLEQISTTPPSQKNNDVTEIL